MGTGDFFPGGGVKEDGGMDVTITSVEVKNVWSYTSTSSYVFMA
jgi:hypothetical protein